MGEGKTESGLKNICLHPANLFLYFLNNRFDLECITSAEHHLRNVSFSFVATYYPFKHFTLSALSASGEAAAADGRFGE